MKTINGRIDYNYIRYYHMYFVRPFRMRLRCLPDIGSLDRYMSSDFSRKVDERLNLWRVPWAAIVGEDLENN